jgi:hypothetical protein
MATATIPAAPDDLDRLYRMTVEEYEGLADAGITAPESDAYKNQQIFGPSDRAPIVINGIEVGTIVVADLLP